MKIETILNAMEDARLLIYRWSLLANNIAPDEAADRFVTRQYKKRVRQYRAFRARILRMFTTLENQVTDLEMEIDMLHEWRKEQELEVFCLEHMDAESQEINEKQAQEIARLKSQLEG